MKKVRTSLGALEFTLISLDNNQIFNDKKKMDIIKVLRKDFTISKPSKGNEVVLIKQLGHISRETVFR